MSFKPCSIVMTADRVTRGLAPDRIAALVDSLSDTFVPFDLSYRVAGGERVTIELLGFDAYGSNQLWRGERATDSPLTRFERRPDDELLERLRPVLSGGSPGELWFSATGALRYCTPSSSSPEWYGRWRIDETVLRELVTVRLEWSKDQREFEVAFALSGYPITATQLPAALPRIEDGDAEIAAENRALLLPVIGRARAALGLDRDEVRWWVYGDYGWLYPEDEADLENTWLPSLRAG